MTDKDINDTDALELTGSIWFASGSQNWGSQRRMALLQAIDETGSISAGARKIGLSYKAAWDAVDTMNTLAAEVLVERTTGGQRGGGARLTQSAKHIVALYHTLSEAHNNFLQQLAVLAGPEQPDLDVIQNLMVVAPARNKLAGNICHLERYDRTHDVTIRLEGGDDLVASISPQRSKKLQLHAGKRVIVFIDMAAILIGLLDGGTVLSARNRLPGRVQDILKTDAGAEVVIKLSNGAPLVSQITPMSLQHLGLHVDAPVQAIFKASSVIVGLPAGGTGSAD
ncbi:MAG TPA: TOBE domain-containing protein [Burkholderiaceae bacterium]|nr:TOBE domain-containing protein [Burkholderiaceae bacterium]